jgi:hypothetical protein
MLSEIEVCKTSTFVLNTANLTTANPVSFAYNRASVNLNFIPDFVKVRMVSFFDPTNNSVGVYNVGCNFIRDNDTLVSIASLPISVANTLCPNITHQFVNNGQLTFTVTLANVVTAPSANSYISLTVDFIQLKKKH